jgi:hypothetical protein
MKLKIIPITFFLLISLVIISGCSSPSEPESSKINILSDSPIISGFYVTTNEKPDGTGEIIGTPAYTVKDINVFPNPFSGYIISSLIRPPNFNEPYIIFNHLPENVTITIVRGKKPQDANNINNSILGIPIMHSGLKIIRTIEKNDSTPFFRWNLKDENSNYVQSGVYRAYISGNGIPEKYWLDISLELQEYSFY